MSPPYRKEREVTRPGAEPMFRVIVKLPRGAWGTVQTGLAECDADVLLDLLLTQEQNKRTRSLSGGYRR